MLKGIFGKKEKGGEAAPAAEAPRAEEARRRVVRVGTLSPVAEVDPTKVRDTVTSLALAQVFEPLYEFADAKTGLVPLLASGPPRRIDEKRFAVPVRQDVTFSDGTPLTPTIVAASLARERGVSSQAGLTARGSEVEVALRAPNPNFTLYLTQTACGIAHQREGRLVGTGPFVLPDATPEALRSAEEIVFPRNPNDREPAATAIDELRFRRFAAPADLAAALEDGTVHYSDSLPVGTGDVSGRSIYPVTKTGISTGVLFANTQRLRDPAVRKALLRAVSRAEVARTSVDSMPMAYVASSLLPSALGEEGAPFPEGEPGAARRLAEGSSGLPKKVTLLATWGPKAYMPRPQAAAESVRDQIAAALGVTVELVLPTRDEYYRLQKAGEYDLLLGGWVPDTPDPNDFYDSLLASSAVPGTPNVSATGNNVSRWVDAETDRLLAAHRAGPSVAARSAIARHVAEHGVLSPLLVGKFVAHVSWNLKRLTITALGRVQFRGATVHS